MIEEFVNLKQAIGLRNMGFNEPCIACFQQAEVIDASNGHNIGLNYFLNLSGSIHKYNEGILISAPTKSQAFKWFRTEYGLHCEMSIDPWEEVYIYTGEVNKINAPDFIHHIPFHFKTYEELEEASIDRIIYLIENKLN